MKSRAPQLHLEYRFYKQLGAGGKKQCHMFYCNVIQYKVFAAIFSLRV